MSAADLKKRLLEEVVIFENQEAAETGAKSIAPDHSPREPYRARAVPKRPLQVGPSAQTETLRRVEQFLYYQAELLDGKHWGAYIDLFAEDGVYWMPATADQTEWLDSPSIFAEDKRIMEIRMGRVTHPNAWSQAPQWGTNHLIGNIAIESETETELVVRSRFQMLELRRDTLRQFAGSYRHTLLKRDQNFAIKLQRVDLLNAQAIFDYVIQVWV